MFISVSISSLLIDGGQLAISNCSVYSANQPVLGTTHTVQLFAFRFSREGWMQPLCSFGFDRVKNVRNGDEAFADIIDILSSLPSTRRERSEELVWWQLDEQCEYDQPSELHLECPAEL